MAARLVVLVCASGRTSTRDSGTSAVGATITPCRSVPRPLPHMHPGEHHQTRGSVLEVLAVALKLGPDFVRRADRVGMIGQEPTGPRVCATNHDIGPKRGRDQTSRLCRYFSEAVEPMCSERTGLPMALR